MKIKNGMRVALKGFGLTGYTGTVLSKGHLGYFRIQLDPGQLRAGNSIVRVRKMNLEALQIVPS